MVAFRKRKSYTPIIIPLGLGTWLVPAIPRRTCKPGGCPHLCKVTRTCTLDPHTAHYHAGPKASTRKR